VAYPLQTGQCPLKVSTAYLSVDKRVYIRYNICMNQVQIKVSVSQQLNDLLQSKAARLGVPITQLVKHLIIKDVEEEEYPTFQASERTEKRTKKALEEYDKAVTVENIPEFFKNL